MYRPASPLVRTSPLGLTTLFDVFIGERGRGLSWDSPPPASALALTDPSSCSTSSRRRAPAPFRMPSPSVPELTPSYRVSPETRRRTFGRTHDDLLLAQPLSWGFAPSSGHQHKGSGCYPGTPTSPAVASSGFEPSRRLDPLRAFPTSLPGPLLGLLPPGLFSSHGSGSSFETPSPPGIA